MNTNKISKELALHRLAQAKEDLGASKSLYNEQYYKSANSRAYYSVFHAIRGVLALEPIDFKRHKSVIAYFNENYVNKGIFPKMIGRKISQAQRIREDSDYDDYEPSFEKTEQQINTAQELIGLVEEYINNYYKNN